MSSGTTSINPSTIWGIFALVAVISAGVTFYVQSETEDDYSPESSVDTPPKKTTSTPSPPNRRDAIKDLFGVIATKDSVKTTPNELTSFWHEQSVQAGSKKLYFVFTATQQLNPSTHEAEGYHGTAPEISAIVYQLTGDTWEIASKSIKFTKFGSWGGVPDVRATDIMLTPLGAVVFMFDSGMSGQGYNYSGKTLFSYSNNSVSDIGYIETGGDNSGICSNDPKEMAEGGIKCWKYTGTISIISGKYEKYPDLLVTRTGTEEGKLAHNVHYSYDGKQYIQASQGKEPRQLNPNR